MTSLSIIAEKVKDAVFQLFFFGAITKNGKPEKDKNEFTLLAGFVVEEFDDKKISSSFRCVALGTGTKCIPSSKRRKDGCVLCDSHAEVIARRALVRWMHEEIFKASTASSPKTSVFVRDACTKMFKLKGNVKLHFFISQPPCGDAAVFRVVKKEKEKEEEEEEEEEEEILQKDTKGRGLKRVKRGHPGVTGAKIVALSDNKEDVATYNINAEFGVSEQETNRCRIKPGRGDLTSSMSCSDKIAKWIMLGLQGTLLSPVISHPVRMSTITIGSNEALGDDIVEHIARSSRRAFIDRIPLSLRNKFLNVEEPPRVVVINLSTTNAEHQCLLQSFSSATRGKERVSCPTSINWYENCGKQEVTVGASGFKAGAPKPTLEAPLAISSNLRKKHVSRLSRRALVEDFIEKVVPTTCVPFENIDSYRSLKAWAGELGSYALHRRMFLNADAFKNWTKKSESLSDFIVQPRS